MTRSSAVSAKLWNTPWNLVYANQHGSFSVKELDDTEAFYCHRRWELNYHPTWQS